MWGLQVGYCLMVGGDRSAFEHIEPLLRRWRRPEHGYDYMGGHGSGHFVKMVHNGIEYGMMQAYAEGFELLEATAGTSTWPPSPTSGTRAAWCAPGCWSWPPTPSRRTRVWSRSSGYVDDTGEGRWTVEQAIEHGVPMPAIAMALFMRFRSRQTRHRSAARCWPPCATSSAATP